MRRGSRLWIALLLLAGTAAGAPRFRFERTVQPGDPGPNRLDPDVPLLTGAVSGNFADLRLYDAAGREVPWLLVEPEERRPEWRPGKLLPVAATKKGSGFEVDLGSVLPVDRLRLDGLGAPFLKRFHLEGGGDRSRWTVLVADGTLFDLPEERLTRTEVEFPAGEYRYLRITWDDRSSAVMRLPDVASARLARPADPAPAVGVPLKVERRESEPGKSRFRLTLPGKGLPVAALELAAGGGHLLRRAVVTEGRLGNGTVVPVPLGENTLRRAVRGDLAAADLRLPIGRPQGPELDLVVEDGDNPPLDLQGASAELEPLPWIYFESADGGALTARYGDPRAVAPRYDLEAIRESLGGRRPAAARWHPEPARAAKSQEEPAKPELPTVGAPLDPQRFRESRAIPDEQAGLTSLLLDAAVLAGSPGLADLRIADAQGRQIPYLVERRDEPLSLPLALGERSENEGASVYRLELPHAALPEARLVLATSARVFERRVLLRGADPDHRRSGREPQVLADGFWRHADPESAAPALVLALPALRQTAFELVVEEGDNAPLPLAPPRLLLPTVRVRFFHPGGGLRLLYGQPGLAAPRYDLGLLAPRLLGEAAREVALVPGKVPAAGRDALPRQAFWGVLLLAVVALLFLLGRLLREQKG